MSFKIDSRLEQDSITVGDFELCRLLLMNDSQYPWFVLVPKRENISEIYHLSNSEQQSLWDESRVLSQLIMNIFNGGKLNTAAIGNIVNQLHLHHVVRYKSDPCWPKPIWGQLPMKPYNDNQIDKIITKLKPSLNETAFSFA